MTPPERDKTPVGIRTGRHESKKRHRPASAEGQPQAPPKKKGPGLAHRGGSANPGGASIFFSKGEKGENPGNYEDQVIYN